MYTRMYKKQERVNERAINQRFTKPCYRSESQNLKSDLLRRIGKPQVDDR